MERKRIARLAFVLVAVVLAFPVRPAAANHGGWVCSPMPNDPNAGVRANVDPNHSGGPAVCLGSASYGAISIILKSSGFCMAFGGHGPLEGQNGTPCLLFGG